ncbi:hypothetical protein [Micromonospora sp. NPDC005205]|uniref:hypothetical protein n=1 Tax=Micromonospora sp. NPDC005205 TaxID=3156714 RepID=UPI0033B97625
MLIIQSERDEVVPPLVATRLVTSAPNFAGQYLTHCSEFDRGGHFAAVEAPDSTRDRLLADAYADQWNDCAAMHAAALRDPDPAPALR